MYYSEMDGVESFKETRNVREQNGQDNTYTSQQEAKKTDGTTCVKTLLK